MTDAERRQHREALDNLAALYGYPAAIVYSPTTDRTFIRFCHPTEHLADIEGFLERPLEDWIDLFKQFGGRGAGRIRHAVMPGYAGGTP